MLTSTFACCLISIFFSVKVVLPAVLPRSYDRRRSDERRKSRQYVEYCNEAPSTYNKRLQAICDERYPEHYDFVRFNETIAMDAMGLHPEGRGVLLYANALVKAIKDIEGMLACKLSNWDRG